MHPVLFAAVALLPGIAGIGLAIAWRLKNAPRKHGPPVRTASLSAVVSKDAAWLLGLMTTVLPLAATALLLRWRWQSLPSRFPIHWGLGGRPDAWTTWSAGSVYGMLLLAGAIVGSLALVGELIARSSPGHEGRAAMVGTSRTILLACAWFITILFCGISLLPLAHDPTNLVPLIVVGCSLFSLSLIGYIAYRTMRMTSVIAAAQNTTDTRFWKAGLIYYNPGDSALMVPKREGFGYTMNFARPASWIIFGAILLVPVLIPVLMHVSSKR